ncbi:MAG: hypothetical protein ACRD8O_05245 [Bryobacteraceae bacterium]
MSEYPIQFPCPVRRLHVAWRKGKWSVEGETRVESMTLPKSHELPAAGAGQGVSGFWYEVVDNQGRAIYRHLIPDPFSGSMEVFNEGGTISRKSHPMHEEILFDVLVPDLPQITAVHFYGSAASEHEHEHRAEKPAERIAALDIRPRKGGDYGRQ